MISFVVHSSVIDRTLTAATLVRVLRSLRCQPEAAKQAGIAVELCLNDRFSREAVVQSMASERVNDKQRHKMESVSD
jgi:hypothetical protein